VIRAAQQKANAPAGATRWRTLTSRPPERAAKGSCPCQAAARCHGAVWIWAHHIVEARLPVNPDA